MNERGCVYECECGGKKRKKTDAALFLKTRAQGYAGRHGVHGRGHTAVRADHQGNGALGRGHRAGQPGHQNSGYHGSVVFRDKRHDREAVAGGRSLGQLLYPLKLSCVFADRGDVWQCGAAVLGYADGAAYRHGVCHHRGQLRTTKTQNTKDQKAGDTVSASQGVGAPQIKVANHAPVII